MTDIRDASAHTDGDEPRPGLLPFGTSPFDTPYAELSVDDLDPDDERPLAPLALESRERTALMEAIQAGLRERGCDNTLRAAKAWARREKVSWRWLRDALEERGGFCDCEVLMNVLN
jgi:hypothetical protein